MLTIIPLFIGTSELLLIAALVLLLFGGKKLPEMMRGLGQGVKAFKEGVNEPTNTDKAPDEAQRQEATTDKGKHETVESHDDGKE